MHACERRLAALEKALKKGLVDSFLVTDEANVYYLSGFDAQDAMIFLANGKRFFITDSRYSQEAHALLSGRFAVEIVTSTTYETLKGLARDCLSKRIGFEAMDLAYGVAERLKNVLAGAKLVPTTNVIESLRTVKDDGEIRLIRNAIRCTKDTLKKALRLIRPGASEKSISTAIETEFIKRGSEASFKPIIATGINASKPHAKAGRTIIRNNSFVMVDIGSRIDGYNSDLTRMIFLGKISGPIKKIYDIVRQAQDRAIRAVKPGVKVSCVDRAARSFIHDHGYGKYFGHATGHGVGLNIHELPSISSRNDEVLRAGMVFTVEPAIYVPDLGGVRIEDMVLVTERGCRILTR